MVLNIGDLEKFETNGLVSKKNLSKKKILRRGYKLKILGNGEIKKPINVEADAFSKSAKESIEKSGGKAVIVEIKRKKRK